VWCARARGVRSGGWPGALDGEGGPKWGACCEAKPQNHRLSSHVQQGAAATNAPDYAPCASFHVWACYAGPWCMFFLFEVLVLVHVFLILPLSLLTQMCPTTELQDPTTVADREVHEMSNNVKFLEKMLKE